MHTFLSCEPAYCHLGIYKTLDLRLQILGFVNARDPYSSVGT